MTIAPYTPNNVFKALHFNQTQRHKNDQTKNLLFKAKETDKMADILKPIPNGGDIR